MSEYMTQLKTPEAKKREFSMSKKLHLLSRNSRQSKTLSVNGYGKTRTDGIIWFVNTMSASIPQDPVNMTAVIYLFRV